MERTVSATEARVRFGELMQRVGERNETVIVERDGVPRVVVLSIDAYERLRESQKNAWDEWESRLADFHAELQARLGDDEIHSSVDEIKTMRAERDEQPSRLP